MFIELQSMHECRVALFLVTYMVIHQLANSFYYEPLRSNETLQRTHAVSI